MPSGRIVALDLVLSASTGKFRELVDHADNRRTVSANALLRNPTDAGLFTRTRICYQFQEGGPVDANDGFTGDLSEAQAVSRGGRTSDLSVSLARSHCDATRPSVVNGYHVHTIAARVCLLGSSNGLVQSLCAILGDLDYHGLEFLYQRAGLGVAAKTAGDLQQRSRGPVHQPRLHSATRRKGDTYQHGWPRESIGQCFRGAAMAQRKMGRGVPEGLPECIGGDRWPGWLFPILQWRTASSVARLSDAGGHISRMKKV